MLKKNPNLTRFRVKSLGTTRIISADKAKQSLGYVPKYDFSSTIHEIAEWYKKDLAGKTILN
jgi:nucleoside-diphosphate-sugar epimerase